MRIDCPSTTASLVDKKLVQLRNDGGAVALGRVLTLVVLTDEDALEGAIEATNTASHEHPCRVLMVPRDACRACPENTPRLDAEIRVGGDAGASEVIVLRCHGELQQHILEVITPLLLPDAPIVVWWTGVPPDSPADDSVGVIASRRITDCASSADPVASLRDLAAAYQPGDTDLAWARVTGWRGILAAAMDTPPYLPVESVVVEGRLHASRALLAAWLGSCLQCPAEEQESGSELGITRVVLNRAGNATISFERPDGNTVTIRQAGMPDRTISMPIRPLSDALIEELRRLSPDTTYAATLELLARDH
ncbi:MAG: glucose-6-phosphate dehydrogenase assembly protein OpcA [Cellulomonadaceae bacterium]|jgi:glucose-6-phosphate dehydrogenase assembly protein OpcA|nr:glucose-6-phosphate dehydrogenase assembly protein OpcA [Cellulomonadaceae bacterium]